MKLLSGKIAQGDLQVHTLRLSRVELTGARLKMLVRAYRTAPDSTRLALEHLDLSENDTSYPMSDWQTLFDVDTPPFPSLKRLDLQPLSMGVSGQGSLLIRNIKKGAFPSIEKVVVQKVRDEGFQLRVTSAVRTWAVVNGRMRSGW
jgi:hypothetical protein